MNINAMRNGPENNMDVKNLLPNEMAFNETEKALVKSSIDDLMPKLDDIAKVYVWKKWSKERNVVSKEKKLTKEELDRVAKKITKEATESLRKLMKALKNNQEKKKDALEAVLNALKNRMKSTQRAIDVPSNVFKKMVDSVLDSVSGLFH